MTKDKKKIKITARGNVFATANLSFCKDGFVISSEDFKDVHLTIMYKDGKFRPHLTDKTMDVEYPWGQQFTPEVLFNTIKPIVERWKREYHGNMKAWKMTESLRQKIVTTMDFPEKNGEIEYPWELLKAEFIFDPENPERWERIKIRDILDKPEEVAFVDDNGVLRRVIPLDRNKMLCFSDRQFNNLLIKVLEMFGLTQYIDYSLERYGKDNIRKKLISRLKEGAP